MSKYLAANLKIYAINNNATINAVISLEMKDVNSYVIGFT